MKYKTILIHVLLMGSMACLLLILFVQTSTVQAGSSSDAAVNSFIASHQWTDDNTKELFTFIYNNVPDKLKERVLAKYGTALTRVIIPPQSFH